MISVIITAYNKQKYLGSAIKSVLSEEYQDFEIVFVNDGSTDKTLDVAMKYTDMDSRVKVVDIPENMGIGFALNTGVEYAQGEDLLILDADDYLFYGALQVFADQSKDHPNTVLFADRVFVNQSGKEIGRRVFPEFTTQNQFRDFVLDGYLTGQEHRFIPKWMVLQVPFAEDLKVMIDVEWVMYSSLIREFDFWHIDQPLTVCRRTRNAFGYGKSLLYRKVESEIRRTMETLLERKISQQNLLFSENRYPVLSREIDRVEG